MGTRIEKLLWFGVSTAIIAGIIYFADFNQFVEALRKAETAYLAPALFFGMAVFTIWNYSWYSFFKQLDLGISYFKSLEIFMAGHLLDSITPLGQLGGEPFMAYIISKNTKASYEEAFSTVLSADIVNAIPGFTFVLGGAVFLLFFGAIDRIVVNAVYLVLLAMVVGGALVYLLWFRTALVENSVLGILGFFADLMGVGSSVVDTIEERLKSARDAFSMIGSNRRNLLKTAIVAHLSFLSQLFCLYFVLVAFGINSDFTPLFFVLALSEMGNYSPTPGGSGTYEALMVGLLTVILPISLATAAAAAIIFRATTYWPGMILGYVSINKLKREW